MSDYEKSIGPRIFPLAICFMSLFAVSIASAHDYWANGDKVPGWVKSSCCGKADAHLLDPSAVHHNAKDGYYYFDGGYKGHVEDARVLPSQDGRYWLFYACDEPTCSVYCFFAPLDF